MKIENLTGLTEAESRQYQRDGFLVLDNLFAADQMDVLQREFQRAWDDAIAHAEKANADARSLRMVRVRPFLSNMHKASPACAAFLKHPSLLELCRQIIGPEAECMYNQAVIKAPEQANNSFAWHQDAYYPLHGSESQNYSRDLLDPTKHFTCWLALTRTTVANGTLWVVPGAHRNGLLPHVRNPETAEWICQFDSSAGRPMELDRGQMLIFCSLTPHQSGPNVSQQTRMAYQFTYTKPGIRRNPSVVPVLSGQK